MVYPPKQLDLIAGLISCVGECSTSKAQHVAKRLREHNFARTNQFAVKSKIEGLLEKFSILGRDDLVALLQTRLDALPAEDKFLPEKLALILNLSDLPQLKVTDKQIRSITEKDVPHGGDQASPTLSEDERTDRDIWENIERGYHSSGDEDTVPPVAQSPDTAQTSVADDTEDFARSQLVQPPELTLKTPLWSELRLIREVLFMLRGLATDTFVVDHRDGSVHPSTTAAIPHTTKEATADVLASCAGLGSSLNFLRGWIKSSSSRSEVRSCQAAAMQHLQHFDQIVSRMELRYVQARVEFSVSILEVLDRVVAEGHTLVQLSGVLRKASRSTSTTVLDQLFSAACGFQSIGDERSLTMAYDIFQAGTVTYVRPMVAWALTGIMDHSNPFVVDLNSDCDLSRLWHDRLQLRATGPREPIYLRTLVEELFAMGKEKLMQNLLTDERECPMPPGLQFGLDPWSPLKQQFNQAIRTYADRLHSQSGNPLTTILIRDNHLKCFDTLESIYLLGDATSFSNFSAAIYDQFRGGQHRYLDDFKLTKLARDSMMPIASMDVCATIDSRGNAHGIIQKIGRIRLHCRLPWIAANIVGATSLKMYEDIFTLLLQLAHAKKILQYDFPAYRQPTSDRLGHNLAMLCCLRHCMTAFVDTIVTHIALQGAQHHKLLNEEFTKAKTFDDLIAAYAGFSRRLGTSIFVSTSTQDLHALIVDILDLTGAIDAAKSPTTHSTSGTTIADIRHSFYRKLQTLVGAVAALETDTEMTEPLASALLACLPRTVRTV